MITALTIMWVVVKTAESQCRWDVASNIALDLSPLQGKIMTTRDSYGYHNYTFSVCSNEVSCTINETKYGMVVQYAEDGLDKGYCWILGQFDESIKPVYRNYNDTGDITWTFIYPNGDVSAACSANYDNTRTWIPTFICDPSLDYSISDVVEEEECVYYTDIRTKYACPSYTTSTTLGPNSECIFRSSDGNNILDMSSIRGDIISSVDNKTNDEYFLYTPCENIVNCHGVGAMTYVLNMETLKCERYLAVWDGGIVEPQYIAPTKTWQFTYTNGEACGPNYTPSTYIVQWICDIYAESPKVYSAQEIAPCVYQMVIDSVLACN